MSPVFLGVVVVLACGLAAAVVVGGGQVRDRARADAVADVTALAGAVDDRAGADRVARANGATVTGLRRSGGVVIVEVALASQFAVAAATPTARPLGSASRSEHSGSLGLGR